MNKVNGVLPAGTDLNAATAGFKNFGGFMSAVNVSSNLGIQFADLKAVLTGTTLSGVPTTSGATASSLGQAIQQLKSGVDATAEAQRAQTQATLETGEASTTNTTSTTSTSSPTSTSSGKGKSK
jgi:hypothetical protein